MISPAPCLQSLAVRWWPFQSQSGHVTSLLSHLPWWDDGGTTQNLSPSWVSPARETWVSRPLDVSSHLCRDPLCFTLGSWNKPSLSGFWEFVPGPLLSRNTLFKHLMKQLLCSLLSDLFNRNFPKRLISMTTQSHSLSPSFSAPQVSLAVWKGPACSWLVHLSLEHTPAEPGVSSVRWPRCCCLFKSPGNPCWMPQTSVWGSWGVHGKPGWFQSPRLWAWRPRSGWEEPYRLLVHHPGHSGNSVREMEWRITQGALNPFPEWTPALCSSFTYRTCHTALACSEVTWAWGGGGMIAGGERLQEEKWLKWCAPHCPPIHWTQSV